MRTASSLSPGVQYAALPWRETDHGIEFLLITTLTTKRWVIPKGWSVPGLQPHETAALEALEEAGVSGDMTATPLGRFSYQKRRKAGADIRCTVSVFPLHVTRVRRQWSEKGRRETQWCSPTEAMARVNESGLRRLIAQFADHGRTHSTHRRKSVAA